MRVLEILINYGFNVNIQNEYGESPLFEAVKSKNIPIIELLLDSGANIDICNNDGNYPLHYAV